MNKLSFLFIALFFLSCQQKKVATINTINPIVGDISYVQQFGKSPNANTDEQVRIKTHLLYVENLLRNKSTNHLNKTQIISRNKLLDNLYTYAEAGVFPKNNDYPGERRPCFIDRDGNICAVGYLVEQSAGLEAAQEINSLFQYATIEEMKSELLENWIENSGLSKNEVAMIQPTYGPNTNPSHVGARHAIPSFVLNALNITFSTMSIAKWNDNNQNANIPVGGIVSGITTLGYTAYYNSKSKNNIYGLTDAQQKVSRINTALGFISVALNGFRLFNYKYQIVDNEKAKSVSFNLSAQPGLNNQPVFGFALTKKFN